MLTYLIIGVSTVVAFIGIGYLNTNSDKKANIVTVKFDPQPKAPVCPPRKRVPLNRMKSSAQTQAYLKFLQEEKKKLICKIKDEETRLMLTPFGVIRSLITDVSKRGFSYSATMESLPKIKETYIEYMKLKDDPSSDQSQLLNDLQADKARLKRRFK